MRRLAAVLALAAGGALWRRRRAGRRERVELHYEDGTSLTLGEGDPAADRLLPLARDLVAAVRG